MSAGDRHLVHAGLGPLAHGRLESPRPDACAGWELEHGDELVPGRTVLRTLGGGTLFEAMLVWDDHRFSLMVAKVLRPGKADDPDALRHLAREAQALERLGHPVLVRGFDAVLEGPRPHLLLEHLEGPTLRSLLRRGGAMAPQQLLPLALHVAAALHYLAVEGWVHLDVKPDNIVMGVPPRLIDLSVARPVERTPELRGPVGTDAYMAPEQCQPAGTIGPAADVFGLAATVFHALVGHVPFPRLPGAQAAEDPAVRFPQLHHDPEPLPARTPPELAELLDRALAREPAVRPTAAEFAADLEPLVAALPRRLVFGRRGARSR